MKPPNKKFPSIDPRKFLREYGVESLSDFIRARTGYVCQVRPLNILAEQLDSGIPGLYEGKRGGGKTAKAKAVGEAFNQPVFYVQCTTGVGFAEMLYEWDRAAQTFAVEQYLRDGFTHADARAQTWTREFLMLGEVLAAYDAAASAGCGLPVVFFTSNNMRSGVSSPLRSRCLYSYIEEPSSPEEIRILRSRVPGVGFELLGQVVKLSHFIRGMGSVVEKPGLRESISLLKALVRKGIVDLDVNIIDRHLGYIAKTEKDEKNLNGQTLTLLNQVAHTKHTQIDGWTRDACQEVLPEASSFLCPVEMHGTLPILIMDEVDKFSETDEDKVLQLTGDGYASVPRLLPDSRIGIFQL